MTLALVTAMNIALFILSGLFFTYGTKALKAAHERHKENMLVLDKAIAESEASHAKHKEVGELLAEVKELAEDIKSGKVQYVQ